MILASELSLAVAFFLFRSPARFRKYTFLLTDLRIEKSIFIKPKMIHLTVLMLKLWNKDRVDAAAEVLQVGFCIFNKYFRTMGLLNDEVFLVLYLDCLLGSIGSFAPGACFCEAEGASKILPLLHFVANRT